VIDTIKSMVDYEDEIISREAARDYAARTFTAPSHQETQTRQRLAQSLSQLRSDAEPQWVKRVDRGRINVPALMSNRGVDLDIFDSWAEAGEDATSIEVVILLDQSASMSHQMNRVSGAMWVLKGACDDLEIPCSVIGYSDKHSVLLGRDDRVGTQKVGRFPSLGSTDPRGALEEAHRIFSGSDRRHKLLFSVTDGEWFHPVVCSSMVREITALGVHTDLIYLTGSTDTDRLAATHKWLTERRWNGHELGAIATSLPAMVKHIDKALASVMLDVIADAV
jgi:Mg-chelatase subunit ChlD